MATSFDLYQCLAGLALIVNDRLVNVVSWRTAWRKGGQNPKKRMRNACATQAAHDTHAQYDDDDDGATVTTEAVPSFSGRLDRSFG